MHDDIDIHHEFIDRCGEIFAQSMTIVYIDYMRDNGRDIIIILFILL